MNKFTILIVIAVGIATTASNQVQAATGTPPCGLDKPLPPITACAFNASGGLYQVYGGASIKYTATPQSATAYATICDTDNCGRCKPKTLPPVTIAAPGLPLSFTLSGNFGFTNSKTAVGDVTVNGAKVGGNMGVTAASGGAIAVTVTDQGSQKVICPTAGKNEHIYRKWRVLPCNVSYDVYARGCYNGTFDAFTKDTGVLRVAGTTVPVNRMQIIAGSQRCK